MAKKKNIENPFISALQDIGYDNIEHGESVTDMNDLDSVVEPDHDINVDDQITDDNKPDSDKEPEDKNKNVNPEPHDDDSVIPDNIKNQLNNQTLDQTPVDGTDVHDDIDDAVDSNEQAGVSAFFDAFAEANHWSVPEEEKPQTVEQLVDYIKDVVEENSQPQYADDRIAQLDKYVKDGGNFEDFYNRQATRMSYNDMDLDDENNQKAVVRDYLKMSGYDDESIKNKIERYEDADLLEDEAKDAVGRLKQYEEERLAEMQKQQEETRQYQIQQAQAFAKDLTDSVSNLTNIRGIAVPKEDRKALFDYITRTDENGLTQYQKDFSKNQVQNLIESAYFTMKGDALLGEANRAGQTTAANKLKQLLKHQTKNHSQFNADEKSRSVADMAAQIWR